MEARRQHRALHGPDSGGFRPQMFGVKKNFITLNEGVTASFDVIAVGADGARVARKGVT